MRFKDKNQKNLKGSFVKRLENRNGESMIETLVSILVITLVFVMLSNTLVVATKGNSAVHPDDTVFHYDGTVLPSETVKIKINGIERAVPGYSVYKTDNDYYYYMNE